MVDKQNAANDDSLYLYFFFNFDDARFRIIWIISFKVVALVNPRHHLPALP
jgi:hypothetical protein